MDMNVYDVPDWHDPILVAAFGGWGDASSVATSAASYFTQGRSVTRAAELDVEDYLILSENRPHVRLIEGAQRRVQWPALTIIGAVGAPRDVAVLLGPEPQLKWRTFAGEVARFWRDRGQRGPVVLLGAFLASVSHAGPVMLTGFATTDDLRARLAAAGIQSSAYEGPTSIHSILAEAFEAEGIPCLSVWAACPHYLAAMPNPKACHALLRAVDGLLGVGLDLRDLAEAAETFEKQVTLAMTRAGHTIPLTQGPANSETPAPETRAAPEPLPPAEDLVRGVEEFLRNRRPD